MAEVSFLPFDLPAISRKKVSANFDGGAISSDGGLLLLREADRRLGLTRMLASCVQDRRDPSRIRVIAPQRWTELPLLSSQVRFGQRDVDQHSQNGDEVTEGRVLAIPGRRHPHPEPFAADGLEADLPD